MTRQNDLPPERSRTQTNAYVSRWLEWSSIALYAALGLCRRRYCAMPDRTRHGRTHQRPTAPKPLQDYIRAHPQEA